MANNYRTDIFLKKLYYIQQQCESARKKKDEAEAEANMDEFTRLRKKIAQDIRDAKKHVHERDLSNAAGESDALVAKQNDELRGMFRDIRADIDRLEKMKNKHNKQLSKQKNPSDEDKQKIEEEEEIVKAAWQHMAALEKMERFGDDIEAQGLFSDETDGPATVGEIPDIDDPAFQQLRRTDAQIEEGLDDILQALAEAKKIAMAMNEELKVQEELIGKVDENMDQVEERLASVNASLKRVLKKVRGPRQFCCDIYLCCLILGIAAGIIYLIVAK